MRQREQGNPCEWAFMTKLPKTSMLVCLWCLHFHIVPLYLIVHSCVVITILLSTACAPPIALQ